MASYFLNPTDFHCMGKNSSEFLVIQVWNGFHFCVNHPFEILRRLYRAQVERTPFHGVFLELVTMMAKTNMKLLQKFSFCVSWRK